MLNDPAEAGFSLVELLVAMGIALSILGAAFTVMSSWQLGFGAENERADQQQRLRVAVHALSRDLALAGAGAYLGNAAGPLGLFVASVFPFRQGALTPDAPGTVRTDTLTLLYVQPQTAAQTTLQQPLAARSGTALINQDAGCPPADSTCGFTAGMDVMVYDDTGAYRHLQDRRGAARRPRSAARHARHPAVVCSGGANRRSDESHLLR